MGGQYMSPEDVHVVCQNLLVLLETQAFLADHVGVCQARQCMSALQQLQSGRTALMVGASALGLATAALISAKTLTPVHSLDS